MQGQAHLSSADSCSDDAHCSSWPQGLGGRADLSCVVVMYCNQRQLRNYLVDWAWVWKGFCRGSRLSCKMLGCSFGKVCLVPGTSVWQACGQQAGGHYHVGLQRTAYGVHACHCTSRICRRQLASATSKRWTRVLHHSPTCDRQRSVQKLHSVMMELQKRLAVNNC